MVLLGALYEPMRTALHRLGTAVGGVGGVGGLCNMGNPEDCQSLAGVSGAYCFIPGIWAGFTGFGLVVLLLWMAPMLLGALLSSIKVTPGQQEADAETLEMLEARNLRSENGEVKVEAFLKVWAGVSILWFVVPFAQYLADPFYRTNPFTFILALAIAAAFPLSWHLSLLALPMSKEVHPLMGLDRPTTVALHKTMGWATAGWAGVHVVGELVYIIGTTGLGALFNLTGKNGENLLFILGITTAVLMVLQTTVAAVRKRPWLKPSFLTVHRVIAVLLLLAAAAHWWPFVFFLLPTAALHAAGAAKRAVGREPTTQRHSLAVFTALIGAFLGLMLLVGTSSFQDL
eukprot:Skav233993  [mRNA]  locus=scaffold2413:55026:56057:+ [translate_table: standard]